MIEYKYCTQCKGNLDLSGDYPKCPNCNIVFYKNSKPTVGVLPVKDGKVLLAKREIDPFKGAFDIIGGFLENGEHPLDGLKREVMEETGLVIRATEILGIYMDQYGKDGDYTLNIHYIGDVIGGEMKAKDDVASLQWVDINNAPTNEGFKNTQEAITDLKIWFQKKQKTIIL